jgi:Tfp pilus assembly protein PilO
MKTNNLKSFIPITIWLIACLGIFAAWLLLYSSLDDKIASINEIKSQTKASEERIKQRRDLKDVIAKLESQKQKIDSVFLNKDTLINFIELLESMSKASGVSLNKNSSSADKNPIFDLSAEGNYNQVQNFLVLLENMPYKISLDDVSMKEKIGAASSTSWVADFRVTLLSYEI